MALPMIAGALLSALGTGLQMRQQQRAQRQQRAARNAASQRQASRQRKITSAIEAQAQRLRAGPRMQQLEEAETTIGEDLRKTLRDSRGAAKLITPAAQGGTSGRISGTVRQAAERSQTKRLQDQADLTRLISRIESPATLRRAEQRGFNDLNLDIGRQANFAGGDAFVDNLAIQRAGQGSAGAGLIAGALQGGGQMLISNPNLIRGLGAGGPSPNVIQATSRLNPRGGI